VCDARDPAIGPCAGRVRRHMEDAQRSHGIRQYNSRIPDGDRLKYDAHTPSPVRHPLSRVAAVALFA
jgi:hypothetical protein